MGILQLIYHFHPLQCHQWNPTQHLEPGQLHQQCSCEHEKIVATSSTYLVVTLQTEKNGSPDKEFSPYAVPTATKHHDYRKLHVVRTAKVKELGIRTPYCWKIKIKRGGIIWQHMTDF